MSIFSKIKDAIFGSAAQAAPSGQQSSSGSPGTTSAVPTASSSGAAAGGTAASGTSSTVDIAPILDEAVASKGEKLNWKTSIVDLMKALDLDSSLTARKELAKELGYTGDTNDSATMNIWLHKQVMQKLAANGGKVPADLQ